MVRKKKYILIFLFTLFVIFCGITLENTCNAFTYNSFTSGDRTFICPQLESGDFKKIVEHFQLEWSFTGNYEDTLIPLINLNIFKTAYNSGDIAINNIAFFRHNGSSSSGDLFMLYFYGKEPMRFTGDYQTTALPRLTFGGNETNVNGAIGSGDYNFYGRKWNWFTYTSGTNPTINGVNATNTSVYHIYASNNSISNPSKALIVPNWNYNGETARVTTGQINLTPSEILNNPWSTPLWIHHPNFAILCQAGDNTQYAVFANTQQHGWGAYNYTNRIYLEDSNNPSSSGSGDSGTVNLDETNSLISGVNTSINNLDNSLNNTPSGDDFLMPTSGELGTYFGVPNISDYESVTKTDNFWLTFTNNLSTALNNTSRYYTVDYLYTSYTIDNQRFSITTTNNQSLKNFIFIVVVTSFVIVEYTLIRRIVNLFKSGVFSQIFRAYSRIDITDLF